MSAGKWSPWHARCRECGRSDVAHAEYGFCVKHVAPIRRKIRYLQGRGAGYDGYESLTIRDMDAFVAARGAA